MPSGLVGRRYQLINLLGAGGMGSVYRAFDRLTGQVVALKQVMTGSEINSTQAGVDLRLALAHEFKMLASLRHPHIIGVLDYGFHEGRPYFTMELLENARTIIEAGGQRPLALQISLIVQLLQALAYLHRRGILHRDLKPSNVLVANDHVKVLDFGLSAYRESREFAGGPTVGTLAYMAPEVLIGHEPSEATDLYAVGMMAYELLTGQHLYNVQNTSQLIDQILYKYLDVARVPVNEPIALVLERLLSKEPHLRYPDAHRVIAALSQSIGQPLPQETVATRESFLQSAQLVGRDAELARLSQALQSAMMGSGSAWLIGGESGVGKSRLLDELRVQAMVRGASVIRGQAVGEGASPYHMWRAPLRTLSLFSDLSDRDVSVLAAIIPDITFLLNREMVPASTPPESYASRLNGVLERILASQEAPLVIILEDLQWARSESLALVAHLNTLIAKLPVLLVASYRDDELPELPRLLPGMNHMRLDRLDRESIARLSAAMLGAVGEQHHVIHLLQRETEGNIFFLIEVVRALAEEAGQLNRIGDVTLPQSVFAGGMRRIVQRRLNRVQAEDRPMLNVAAAAGRELDLDLLRAVDPSLNLERWLLNCANAAVLEVEGDEWRFTHDKLREGVLLEIAEDAQAALHERIARTIESLHDNLEDFAVRLAHHWGRAGHHEKEQRYATTAGEQALRIGAYRDALSFFERALELVEVSDAPERSRKLQGIRLRSRIAEAHLGLGEYAAAQALYQQSLEVAREVEDHGALAHLYNSLGDVDYALADFESAEQRYQRSLELARDLQEQRLIARALNNLGNVAYELGDDKRAKQLYQESLAINRVIGGQWGMAGSLGGQVGAADDSGG